MLLIQANQCEELQVPKNLRLTSMVILSVQFELK